MSAEPAFGGGPELKGRGAREQGSGRRAFTLTLLIALVALGIRVWYGQFQPTAGRYHDERYALENVGHVLMTGELPPANGYHPSLSWLPQLAVLGALWQADEALTAGGHVLAMDGEIHRPRREPPIYPFRPLAYRIGRGLQAVLGTATVLLTFVVGRRLWGPVAGLVAALLLACSPSHVRASAIINEDAMLVLTTLLAFHWSLSALAEGSRRRYAGAGLGIGLALASKFNAAPAALPLVFGTLAARRGWRALPRLVLAGAVAIATFFALNPWIVTHTAVYTRDFGVTLRDYERKAAESGVEALRVVLDPFVAVTNPALLGRAGGILAVLGVAWLLVRVWRHRRPQEIALLALLLGYPAAYALATRNLSLHNWLPITPFLALAAGLAISEVAAVVARRARGRVSRIVLPAALALLLLALTLPQLVATYRSATPDTYEAAVAAIRQLPGSAAGRLVVLVERPDRFRVLMREAAVVEIDEVGALDGVMMQRSDALVVPSSRDVLPPPGAELRAFRPSFLRRQGPALDLFLLPWERAGEEVITLRPLGRPRRLGATLPPATEWLSFRFAFERREADLPTLRLGGEDLPTHWLRSRGSRVVYLSARLPGHPQPALVELLFPRDYARPPQEVHLQVLRWRWAGEAAPPARSLEDP